MGDGLVTSLIINNNYACCVINSDTKELVIGIQVYISSQKLKAHGHGPATLTQSTSIISW